MPWYALKTIVRREFYVRDEIEALGHECFTPIEVRRPRRRRGGKRRMEVAYPRLPGYVFGQFEDIPWLRLTAINGLLGFVRKCVDGVMVPAPIPWQQIEAARALSTFEVIEQPDSGGLPALGAGQAVRIVDGPFAGIKTTVSPTLDGHYKALVDFLGKAHEVNFEREQLEQA